MIYTPTIACVPTVAPVRAPWSMPLAASVVRSSDSGTWQLATDHTVIGNGHFGDMNHVTTGFKRPEPGFFDEVST